MMNGQQETIWVYGVGNPLMGDDGAGIQAIELLAQKKLPDYVIIQEIGTPGWGLGAWFEGKNKVIIIDAVQMGKSPGSYKRLCIDDITFLMNSESLSLHQQDLVCGLKLTDELGLLPEALVLYGIEPEQIAPVHALSLSVQSKLPGLVDEIFRDLERGIL